jgi:4'-phosphopantetheinyl transferase EntD
MQLSGLQVTGENLFGPLFPAGVTWHFGDTPVPDAELIGSELSAAASMSPERLAAFRLGRHCARMALKKQGLDNVELPLGLGRAPVWPYGFVGSISHTGSLALSAAAPSNVVSGLGIDVEKAGSLDLPLLEIICRPEEVAGLEEIGPPEIAARLLFSAKESVYKCIWPRLRRYVDFLDVGIEIDTHQHTYRIASSRTLPESLSNALQGRYRWSSELVATSAYLD